MSDNPKLPNLLKDEWLEGATARVEKLYPKGQHRIARMLVRTNARAIDYLEQCPALLVYLAWGRDPKKFRDYLPIVSRFSLAIKRGPKLKELIEEFHGCYPARKIKGGVVYWRHFKAIMELRRLPPSVVAQAIPDTKSGQAKFLEAFEEIEARSSRLPANRRELVFLWAVKTISAEIIKGDERASRQIVTVFDMISRGRIDPNPSWTWPAAVAAAERWHDALAKQTEAERFVKANGFTMEQKADYEHLPLTAEIKGYEFIALRSAEELFEEGRAMKHCVGSYARDVIKGTSRIYSIRQHGCRIATMELVPTRHRVAIPTEGEVHFPLNSGPIQATETRRSVPVYKLEQIQAICNSPPPPSARPAVEEFLEQINFRYGTRDPNSIMTPRRPLRRMGNV